MGILSIGAIDVPRGSDATESDLRYILHTVFCYPVLLLDYCDVDPNRTINITYIIS